MHWIKEAVRAYPDMGFGKLLFGTGADANTDGKHVASSDQVFTAKHICMNKRMKTALLFSPKENLSEDLNKALSEELPLPSSDTEKAGAGILLSRENFTIIRKLGQSAFCSVYEASYNEMRVALKVMAIKAIDILKGVYRELHCSSCLRDAFVVHTLGYFILNDKQWEGNEVAMTRNDILHIVVVDELGTHAVHSTNCKTREGCLRK